MHIDRVNVDEDPEPMRALGLRRYPALACDNRTVTAIFLTRRKIRKFLSKT